MGAPLWFARLSAYAPSSMEPEEQEAYLSLYHLLFDPLEALRKSLLKARSAKQQAEALVQYLEEDGFIERLQATIDETYLDDPDTAAQASEFLPFWAIFWRRSSVSWAIRC